MDPNNLKKLGENDFGKYIKDQMLDLENRCLREDNTYVGLKVNLFIKWEIEFINKLDRI